MTVLVSEDELSFEPEKDARTGLVSGLFADADDATRVMHQLHDDGYPGDGMRMLTTAATDDALETRRIYQDREGRRYVGRESVRLVLRSRAWRGFGIGSLLGWVVGGGFGALLAAESSVLVASLQLLVPGAVIAGLASAGAAALLGGIGGLVLSAGRREYAAPDYEAWLAGTSIILSVPCRDSVEVDEIERIFADHGALALLES